MNWKHYASAMLIFNLLGFLMLYVIQRLQVYFPLNPQAFSAVSPALAFNTATGFITNTDWQAYVGEASLSYFTQMLGLTVQNFLSAATGMALLMALIRSFVRREETGLGNFWVDTVRGIIYILLPLALLFAIILSSLGVIQNFKPYQTIHVVQPSTYPDITKNARGLLKLSIKNNTEQTIPMGPVASQVAIKQLGSNGGGFFNANSAHPFENPTPLTNFLEMLAILLIPAALCYTFGLMVNNTRQGWTLLLAMCLILIPLMMVTITAEQNGNPAFSQLKVDQMSHHNMTSGGNMEGKETRFGIINSAMWATATTATSNGSFNAMYDSFTPIGGLIPLWLMHLGEIIFGGVGSGLYSMLMAVILTVFIAGLMVGRTPEYLGKKIEPFEMKMAVLAILIMPLTVLLCTAVAVVTPMGTQGMGNPGAHGFTEILYAFTSLANNNGSSFAGLDTNTPFYNFLGGIVMLIGRYWIAIPILAIAGSLVEKKIIPTNAGTLQTHNFFFVILLIITILILGALVFFPALALGPVIEQLMLGG
jgi:K+-transporting ATPase ATPase A chain